MKNIYEGTCLSELFSATEPEEIDNIKLQTGEIQF